VKHFTREKYTKTIGQKVFLKKKAARLSTSQVVFSSLSSASSRRHGRDPAAEEAAGARLHAGAPRFSPRGTPRDSAAGAGAPQGRRPPLPVPRPRRRRVRGPRLLRRAHRVRAPQPRGRHRHVGTSPVLCNQTDGLMRIR
jgi:hypothetical protein